MSARWTKTKHGWAVIGPANQMHIGPVMVRRRDGREQRVIVQCLDPNTYCEGEELMRIGYLRPVQFPSVEPMAHPAPAHWTCDNCGAKPVVAWRRAHGLMGVVCKDCATLPNEAVTLPLFTF